MTPASCGDQDPHSDRDSRLGTKGARLDFDQMTDAVEAEPEPLQGCGPAQHTRSGQRHTAQADRLQQSVQQHTAQCSNTMSQLQQTGRQCWASMLHSQQSQKGAGQLSTLGDTVNAFRQQLEQVERRQQQVLGGFGAEIQTLQQTLASLTAAQQQQKRYQWSPAGATAAHDCTPDPAASRRPGSRTALSARLSRSLQLRAAEITHGAGYERGFVRRDQSCERGQRLSSSWRDTSANHIHSRQNGFGSCTLTSSLMMRLRSASAVWHAV